MTKRISIETEVVAILVNEYRPKCAPGTPENTCDVTTGHEMKPAERKLLPNDGCRDNRSGPPLEDKEGECDTEMSHVKLESPERSRPSRDESLSSDDLVSDSDNTSEYKFKCIVRIL